MARNRGEKQETELFLRTREREAAGSGPAANHQSKSAEQQQVIDSSHDGEGGE